MPLPKFLANIFGGGASELISAADKLIDNLTISKEEKEAFKAELNKSTNDHIEKMTALAHDAAELEFKKETAYLVDIANARALQIEALKQEDKFAKRFVYYLAIGVLIITFTFDLLFFFIQYPERNHDIINMIAGTLNSTALASVIYFFFGSSNSSKANGDAMRKMLDNK